GSSLQVPKARTVAECGVVDVPGRRPPAGVLAVGDGAHAPAAGSYVSVTSPLVVVTASTRRSAAARPPLRKRRLPAPSTAGWIMSLYSSMSPLPISDWASPDEPRRKMSLPGSRFSSPTWPRTSSITVVSLQEPSRTVVEARYLGTVLSIRAISSPGSVTVGQYRAQIS